MSKSPRTVFFRLLSLTLLAGLLAAGPASASRGQVTYFEAGQSLLNPSTRVATLHTLETLGVNAIRVELSWYSVAPGAASAAKPAFAATDPASYNWSEYDFAISEAARLHWNVLLTVSSPVPRWATSNKKAPYVTRPDRKDFGEFMTAVALHFGSQVSLYSIWNEANHPAFLLPQWSAGGTPASPRIYRGLYQAGYEGLQAAGLSHPKVLFGETAPTGYDTVSRREGARSMHDVAPLAFLREALCLNSRYKKSGACTALPMSGYAHHAYFKSPAGPHYVPPQRDNVTIAALSRLSHALDKAAAAHAIPAHLPIFLTEFGIESKPNKYENLPVSKQAEYDAVSEHMAWSNPRVAAFSQYLLKDDKVGGPPGSGVHDGTVGFQTGVEYFSGSPKPLFYGFPLPLTVSKRRGGVALWGLVRPAAGATSLTVLVERKGSHSFKTLKTVTTDSHGYWSLRSALAGQAWRVRWVSPTGTRYEGPPIRAY